MLGPAVGGAEAALVGRFESNALGLCLVRKDSLCPLRKHTIAMESFGVSNAQSTEAAGIRSLGQKSPHLALASGRRALLRSVHLHVPPRSEGMWRAPDRGMIGDPLSWETTAPSQRLGDSFSGDRRAFSALEKRMRRAAPLSRNVRREGGRRPSSPMPHRLCGQAND